MPLEGPFIDGRLNIRFAKVENLPPERPLLDGRPWWKFDQRRPHGLIVSLEGP